MSSNACALFQEPQGISFNFQHSGMHLKCQVSRHRLASLPSSGSHMLMQSQTLQPLAPTALHKQLSNKKKNKILPLLVLHTANLISNRRPDCTAQGCP